jgi:hypothetical protein
MSEEHAKLVFIEQLDRCRVDDDERGVDPVGPGIEERRLGDVQLGNGGPVEGGCDLGVQLPESGKLRGPYPNRVPLKQQPNTTLPSQHRKHLADQVVHAGHRP